MQKYMSPFVYSLYMLVLKHGMTPEDVYLACKDKTANIPNSIVVGPFGSESRPRLTSTELIRRWLCRTLPKAGLNGSQGPLYPLVTFDDYEDKYFMPLSLADFIYRHATENIKLTWWDRFKRYLYE